MPGKIKVDVSQLLRFENTLNLIEKRAIPFAARSTLNAQAFNTRRNAVRKYDQEFILRNKFTTNSLRVTKAKFGLSLNSMKSTLWTPLDYLAKQEVGGLHTSKEGSNVAIPTTSASGEGKRAGSRRRTVRGRSRLSNIRLSAKRLKNGVSKKQKNFVAVKLAAEGGPGVAHLELSGGRKGLFKVWGRGENIRVQMLYDLSQKSVTVTPKNIISDAAKKSRAGVLRTYERQVKFQMRRLGFK